MALLCLFALNVTAHAFGNTQCAASRKGSDLICTAGDVSITGIAIAPGGPTFCVGGSTFPADLDITVNFAVPDRWDVGIFLTNDGKDPLINDPTASCSVGILPPASPFADLDGVPKGTTDTCGDGSKSIVGGGTGSAVLRMSSVPVSCQAINYSGGKLYIPFVVSWDNQASPSGSLCNTIADPVPNTVSKCNSPKTSVAAEVLYGTVDIVVLPSITKSDGITLITPGAATTYTVVITNTTGMPLSGAVFTDPAVTNLTANSLSCSATGGATCPAGITVAAMQGAGITIPDMPVNSSVTFTINASLAATPTPAGIGSVTNTANVSVSGQTNSASDTDTIRAKITAVKSLVPATDSGTFDLLVNAATVATAVGNNGSGSTYVTPGAVTVSETAAGVTNLANYVTTYSCTDGTSGTGTSLSLTATAGQIISCTFTNTRKATITVNKSLNPASDAGTFNLLVGATTVAAAIGNGGSGSTQVPGGVPVTVSETAAGATNPADYDTSYNCSGGITGNGSSVTITPIPAESISCTFTNSKKVNLNLQKRWVSANINDAVSLTATGLAPLVSVADSANETDAAPVQIIHVGDVITIDETFTVGTAANYSQSLSCSGNATPLAGNVLTVNSADTAIICTYTNSGMPSITVLKSVQTYSDPINNTTNPKAIPGAYMTYTIQVINSGPGKVDSDSTVITDIIPANTVMCVTPACNNSNPPVTFSCSVTPACGLTFDPATDVSYSYQPGGGAPYVNTPTSPDVAGFDAGVKEVRFNPKGIFSNASGGISSTFSLFFKVLVK